MRLALMTANFCMERNAGAEKEDGKCSQLEDGKVECFASTTDFPDFQGWFGVLKSRMRPRGPRRAAATSLAIEFFIRMAGWTWTRSM